MIPSTDAYEDALELALLDIKSIVSDTIRVAVVGAGRGPLVKATINAAVKASVSNRLKVYAVEKNPKARGTPYAHRAQSENWAAVNAEIFMATVECGKRLKSATFLFLNC